MQKGQSILRHPIPPGLDQNATELGARLNGVPPTRTGVKTELHPPDHSLAGYSQGVPSSRPQEAATQWLLTPRVF